MKAHILAMKARVESDGLPVHLIDVPPSVTPAYPYVLLWSSTGDEDSDDLGSTSYLNDQVGVTCVGLTPEAVWDVVSRTRAVLLDWRPTVSGWYSQPLSIDASDRIQADRDVTLPNVNRHPYYGVDLYRLVAEPVELEDES